MNPQLAFPMEGTGVQAVGDRVVIASVSGGKDSAAMSLYLKEREISHERVFMDTGWEHPLTYEYLRGPLTKALGAITEIRAVLPADAAPQSIAGAGMVEGSSIHATFGDALTQGDFVPLDFLSLVKRKGMFPSRIVRYCTEELKVKPIQRYLAKRMEYDDVVNAVGIRRAESKARSKMSEWEWSDTMDCWVWRPLATWSKEDVIAIHRRHGLPMNPLYDMGATRVGCWPCIHARKSEIALVNRMDPARIGVIRELERELNEKGAARDQALGRETLLRSMFWWHRGVGSNVPIPIDDAVAWANSKRGEWQPAGAGDGCARHGICQTDDEDGA